MSLLGTTSPLPTQPLRYGCLKQKMWLLRNRADRYKIKSTNTTVCLCDVSKAEQTRFGHGIHTIFTGILTISLGTDMHDFVQGRQRLPVGFSRGATIKFLFIFIYFHDVCCQRIVISQRQKNV